IVFTPQADLAILNYIANYIITTNRVNHDFVGKHATFKKGVDDIGYGLRPEHALEVDAKHTEKPGDSTPMTYDEYVEFVKPYTAEHASKISGVPVDKLAQLAEL